MSIEQFKYQPQKIKAGVVYHYIKSNVDGSYPARIHIRVMDADTLDVWKFEEHNADAAHVRAHMDWAIFSADGLQSAVVVKNGSESPRMKAGLSRADSSFTVQFGEMKDTIQIPHFPAHVYNFDFISLIFALPHWVNPEGSASIGVIQPNFNPERPGMIHYEGTVTIQFAARETRNGADCRKYAIGGDGLQGKSGFLWVDPGSEDVVDVEIPVADNPDWDDFKLKLESTQQMNDTQWKEFINSQIKKLDG